ncbi:MAG: ATP-binding protein [Pikeienuella sp.]|uniref:ATP-binding protein n=1 Tax=Pikeienuella sp. TaxID=2831957 RepID=UPI00391DDEA7
MRFTKAMALRSTAAILLCLAVAEAVVFVMTVVIEPERLVFELSVTAAITLMIATPVILYFVTLTEELRAAKLSAAAADRAKSAFLANMSHEIRTPMNGVLGVAELLDHTPLDERQKGYVGLIKSSGDALLTIIDEVLDLSKVEAGRMELRPEPFSPHALVGDAAALMAARVGDGPVEVMARVAPSVPETLIGDGGRLRQILLNFAGNAVKFTERGHVLIEATGAPRRGGFLLRLAVEDTGPGVPREERVRIFEAFRQGDETLRRRHQGVGLGLAVSASLTRLMNGAIWVEAGPEGGARFVMEALLPAEAAEAARPLEGARLLLVSVSGRHARILEEALSAAGARSRTCATAAAAAALLQAGEPAEAALLDWRGEPEAEIALLDAAAGQAGAGLILLTPFGSVPPPRRPGLTLMRPVCAAALTEAVNRVRAAARRPARLVS